jgi:hypothetical protein
MARFLNISKQIYAAYDSSSKLVEADIVPWGSTANEKNRLDRVTKKYNTVVEHENIPLPGFTLYEARKARYGSADGGWLVIDPRGFLGKITSQNLDMILSVTGITEGLIQERCVWARQDSQTKVSLIPISSPRYVEAENNTKLLDQKVSLKEVNIGDRVLLENKLEGEYMGVLNFYRNLEQRYKKSYIDVIKDQKRQVLKVDDKSYFFQSNLKILKVLESTPTPLTRAESAEILNAAVQNGDVISDVPIFPGAYVNRINPIRYVSESTVDPVISFVEISENELSNYHPRNILLVKRDNTAHLIDSGFPGTGWTTRFHTIPVIAEVNTSHKHLVLAQVSRGHAQSRWNYQRTQYTIDNFEKFYCIVKHVNSHQYI